MHGRAGVADAAARAPGRRRRPRRVVRPLGDTAYLVEAGGRRLVAKVGPGCATKPTGCASSARRPEPHRCPTWCSSRPTSSSPPRSTRRPDSRATTRRSGAAWRGCTGRPTRTGAAARRGSGPAPSTRRRRSDGHAFYGARLLDLSARCALEHVVAPWPHASGSSFRPAARPLCTATSGGATSSSGATAAPGSSTRPRTVGIPRRIWRCSASSARCPTGCSMPTPRSNRWKQAGKSARAVPAGAAPRPRRAVRRGLPGRGGGRGAALRLRVRRSGRPRRDTWP